MHKKLLRIICQGLFIFLFFYFFKKTSFPVSEKLPVNIFFRIDLLLAIFTTISTLHFSYLFFPSIGIFSLLLLFGNFFCFYLCPFGGMIDFLNIILFRKRWKIHIKIPSFIRKIRIFIFLGFILTSVILIFIKIPFIFWLFDPYVILVRSLLFKEIFIIFITIIFLSVLIPRLWCNNICPLGYLNYLIGVKLRSKIKNMISKNGKKKIFKDNWGRVDIIINKKMD